MQNTQFQMPHPFEVHSLVETYTKITPAELARLANNDLRTNFGTAVTNGQGVVRLLSIDGSLTRPADYDLDGAWGGLDDLTAGTLRILTVRGPSPLDQDEEARFKYAQHLKDYWIGPSLKFLQFVHASEWRESQTRLTRLDEPMHDNLETPRQAIIALGFEWALKRLQATHATYGRVLGLSELSEDDTKKLDAWEAALDHFLFGLKYHHRNDPEVLGIFLKPYENAIDIGRQRRRHEQEKRDAKKTPKTNPTEAPKE